MLLCKTCAIDVSSLKTTGLDLTIQLLQFVNGIVRFCTKLSLHAKSYNNKIVIIIICLLYVIYSTSSYFLMYLTL